MSTASTATRRRNSGDATTLRRRIVDAAFASFMKRGYAATTTLEIATRARVSKRELYALIGNKQHLLIACIRERAARLHVPADLPALRDRDSLAHVLASFGAQLLHEISDPAVIAVFRLAIAEAVQAPEVARTLDSIGREARRAALREIMVRAQDAGLLEGDPTQLSDQFGGLLMGDLMMSLLLGVAARPNRREIAERARRAGSAFLKLHPLPSAAMRRPATTL